MALVRRRCHLPSVQSRYMPPLTIPGTYSPVTRPSTAPSQSPVPPAAVVLPSVVIAIHADQRDAYTGGQFTRIFAHTTAEASAAISGKRPRLVLLDWDEPSLDPA